MLRVTFHSGTGDSPTLLLASCLRFCADGTLRGPDNCVVARFKEGLWHVGAHSHREIDCEGPVQIRLRIPRREDAVHHGPFLRVHSVNGTLFGDGAPLHVILPGRTTDGATSCQELTLLAP